MQNSFFAHLQPRTAFPPPPPELLKSVLKQLSLWEYNCASLFMLCETHARQLSCLKGSKCSFGSRSEKSHFASALKVVFLCHWTWGSWQRTRWAEQPRARSLRPALGGDSSVYLPRGSPCTKALQEGSIQLYLSVNLALSRMFVCVLYFRACKVLYILPPHDIGRMRLRSVSAN